MKYKMYQKFGYRFSCISIFLLIYFLQFTTCLDDLDSTSDVKEEFIPTSEWQEVKAGQTIPAGLHVKMDLEHGGRWAKLMDEKEVDSTSVVISANAKNNAEETGANNKMQQLQIDEIKSAIRKIKEEKIEQMTDDQKEAIKNKFRSMDEIKSEFERLNLTKRTDFEVMTKLLTDYKASDTSKEKKLLALQDLEYYVHQVDNAVDFVKLDGIVSMVKAINGTDADIILEAAHVIGSAVQNNPAVQVKAIEAGALPTLIRLVADAKQAAEVRKKALYAVSSLLRHFPAAQYFFKNSGGFMALASCFKEDGTDKLRMKVLSLINDLVVERQETHQNANDHPDQQKEKIRQYKLFSLASAIEEMQLCSDISDMLDIKSHDQREMLVTAMKNLHGICRQKDTYLVKARNYVRNFEIQYKELSQEEENNGDKDSFFHQMHKTVKELLNLLENDAVISNHTEL